MKDMEHHIDTIDRLWPARELLDKIGFGRRVTGRVADYLASQGLEVLSLRQLMDQFLPVPPEATDEPWRVPPISRQRQFGLYLFKYALATLSTVNLGEEFEAEWESRLHHYRYTKTELITFAKRNNRDKGASSCPKESPGKTASLPHNSKTTENSTFYPDVIEVSRFRDISIHFPGDVYLLAVWVVASNAVKSKPTCICGTTLRGLAGKFVSMYGPDSEKPFSTKDILEIFEANGITGNPVICRDSEEDHEAIKAIAAHQ